jgi:hypothetical protein
VFFFCFKVFYEKGSNGVDLARHKGTADYRNWGKKQYVNLAKNNPVKFLLKTHSEFFYTNNDQFCIDSDLEQFKNNPVFISNFSDAIRYRIYEFYKNRLQEKLKSIEIEGESIGTE